MPKKSKQQTADSKQLEQQVGELTEALQRERADVINIRRRHDEQMGNLKRTIKSQVIRELLPAIDNLDRAIQHAPVSKDGPWKQWIDGVVGARKQFEKALRDLGVVKIKTVGEPFDPRLHEAVSMEHSEGNSLSSEEIVSEELQPGYMLDDEVLRHAMVKVRGGK